MAQALRVFLIGLGGVFVGMALLYAAIRITAGVLSRGQPRGAGDE